MNTAAAVHPPVQSSPPLLLSSPSSSHLGGSPSDDGAMADAPSPWVWSDPFVVGVTPYVEVSRRRSTLTFGVAQVDAPQGRRGRRIGSKVEAMENAAIRRLGVAKR